MDFGMYLTGAKADHPLIFILDKELSGSLKEFSGGLWRRYSVVRYIVYYVSIFLLVRYIIGCLKKL